LRWLLAAKEESRHNEEAAWCEAVEQARREAADDIRKQTAKESSPPSAAGEEESPPRKRIFDQRMATAWFFDPAASTPIKRQPLRPKQGVPDLEPCNAMDVQLLGQGDSPPPPKPKPQDDYWALRASGKPCSLELEVPATPEEIFIQRRVEAARLKREAESLAAEKAAARLAQRELVDSRQAESRRSAGGEGGQSATGEESCGGGGGGGTPLQQPWGSHELGYEEVMETPRDDNLPGRSPLKQQPTRGGGGTTRRLYDPEPPQYQFSLEYSPHRGSRSPSPAQRGAPCDRESRGGCLTAMDLSPQLSPGPEWNDDDTAPHPLDVADNAATAARRAEQMANHARRILALTDPKNRGLDGMPSSFPQGEYRSHSPMMHRNSDLVGILKHELEEETREGSTPSRASGRYVDGVPYHDDGEEAALQAYLRRSTDAPSESPTRGRSPPPRGFSGDSQNPGDSGLPNAARGGAPMNAC